MRESCKGKITQTKYDIFMNKIIIIKKEILGISKKFSKLLLNITCMRTLFNPSNHDTTLKDAPQSQHDQK